MKSVRQRIIEELKAAIQDIKTTSGYNSDIGNNVAIGVLKSDRLDVPLAVILPKDEILNYEDFVSYYSNIISINAFVKPIGSDSNFVAGEEVLADIKKAVLFDNTINYVDIIKFENAFITYPDSGEEIINVSVDFRFNYRVDNNNPYDTSLNVTTTTTTTSTTSTTTTI